MKPFGFGTPGRVPSYTPGAVQSSPMGAVKPASDFDEMIAMLQQQSGGQIKAPKNKAMGFLGEAGRRLAGGKYGKEDMGWIERLGRGPDGMNAIRDELRADKKVTEEEVKRREIAESMGMYDGQAGLFAMDPAMALSERRDARDFAYGMGRDKLGDQRYADETGYMRGRDKIGDERYADETQYGRKRDQVADQQWGAEFGLRKSEAENPASGNYGLTPVWGQDAQGNPVLMQPSKGGGLRVAETPEGVSLLDPYQTAYDRTLGASDAKVAAYESTAGRALTAFETKADTLMAQIDTAIDQTKGGLFGNTGMIGQFIAAGDLDGTLDAIGAKAMLSELVAIKEQGGTMGALSDSEGKALRDAAVNVARSQSEEQLDANLRAYRLQVERSKMVLKQAFEEQYVRGQGTGRGAPAAAASAGARVGPSGQAPPPGFE